MESLYNGGQFPPRYHTLFMRSPEPDTGYFFSSWWLWVTVGSQMLRAMTTALVYTPTRT